MHLLCTQRKRFDRVPKRVLEWVVRTKGIVEVLAASVMCQYKAAKTRVQVSFEYSVESELNVWIHIGSMLSPFLFTVMLDVVTELATESV